MRSGWWFVASAAAICCGMIGRAWYKKIAECPYHAFEARPLNCATCRCGLTNGFLCWQPGSEEAKLHLSHFSKANEPIILASALSEL
jgi:hypothetical protein